jgi:hypothetical protein
MKVTDFWLSDLRVALCLKPKPSIDTVNQPKNASSFLAGSLRGRDKTLLRPLLLPKPTPGHEAQDARLVFEK